MDTRVRPYKERKSLIYRQLESQEIVFRFPSRIPVVTERYKKEVHLRELPKDKYLVPLDMELGQFISILRNHLSIGASQALYVTVGGKHFPTLSRTMDELYRRYVDEDGFLYLTYASEETFG